MAETSTSGRPDIPWEEVKKNLESLIKYEPYMVCETFGYLESRIKYEPYMVRETFGFRNLDSMYGLVEACTPFHCIITAHPTKFIPSIVNTFFYNWNKGDFISAHTVTLGMTTVVHHINVLDAAKLAFDIGDGGPMKLSKISKSQLQGILDRVLIVPEQYKKKSFKRTEL